jgi:hypothetical protein
MRNGAEEMTFEEWWKTRYDCCCDCKDSCAADYVKCKAKRAWEAAQPKWTYCKDRYPTEVDGEVKKGCIGFRKNLRLVGVIGLSRDSDFGFEVTFNLTENHFESDDREVIAWMPLPEAPAEINSGFNKQGANI